MDNKQLKIPKKLDDDQANMFANKLTDELLGFKEVSKSGGGNDIVSLAKHDDTVMALAMACKKVRITREYEDSFGFA